MALTLGTGPLSATRAGDFDAGTRVSGHPLYLEELDRRVRGYLGGELVVDTRRARLLHEAGRLPVWWLPTDDVRSDLLSPTQRTSADRAKGQLRAWDLRVGDRHVSDAAHDVVEPVTGGPSFAGLVEIDFDALDRWTEEEDEVVGHPRDPYHRVDTRRSSDHVVVRVAGRVVAESSRPVKLFETGLPVRYYLPAQDVRSEHLSSSLTRTICPYKGIASYWSITVGGTVVEDGAWAYPDPLGEVLQVREHLCFLADGIETTAS